MPNRAERRAKARKKPNNKGHYDDLSLRLQRFGAMMSKVKTEKKENEENAGTNQGNEELSSCE